MFSRKLLSLGYSDPSATFSENDSFRDLVVWLECTHIKAVSESERTNLKNVKSPEWENFFNDYLSAIRSPYNATSDRNTVISWLLGRAVRQAYSEKTEDLKILTAEKWQAANSGENPLDNFDLNHEAFVNLSQNLAQLLSIPPYSDHKEVLDAACILIVDRLKSAAVVAANSSTTAKRTKIVPASSAETSFPLSSTPLGFDTGDYVLNDLAKVLRLQHINELRELQTMIDEAIVTVQKITANPKTDTRLGKHGF